MALVKRGAGGERVVVNEKHPEKVADPIKLEAPRSDFVSGSNGSDVEPGSLKIEVMGLQALEDNLRRMGAVAMDAAGCEMENISADVIAEAREIVPYLTGALHDSGNYDRYNKGTALVRPPTILQMKMWFGAPPSEGSSEEGGYAYVQTTDSAGNVIEQGRKIGHLNTGVVKLKGKHAKEAGASEIMVDPSEYAWKQHEDLTFHHPLGSSVGGGVGESKYLEKPYLRRIGEMLPRIARAVAAVYGSAPAILDAGLASAMMGS